jgi:hypothetical protein
MADSWVPRKGRLQTPSGPEGSSGSNRPLVPRGNPAISYARNFLVLPQSLGQPLSLVDFEKGVGRLDEVVHGKPVIFIHCPRLFCAGFIITDNDHCSEDLIACLT